jgi:hypothetical protein
MGGGCCCLPLSAATTDRFAVHGISRLSRNAPPRCRSGGHEHASAPPLPSPALAPPQAGPTPAVQLWTVAQGARVGGEAERLYVAAVDVAGEEVAASTGAPAPAAPSRLVSTPPQPPVQRVAEAAASVGPARFTLARSVAPRVQDRTADPSHITAHPASPSGPAAEGRVWVVRGFHHPALYADVICVPLGDVTWGSGAVAAVAGDAAVDEALCSGDGVRVWVRFRHSQHKSMTRGVARVMSREALVRLGDGLVDHDQPTSHPLARWHAWKRAHATGNSSGSSDAWLVVTCDVPQRGVARGQVLVLYADTPAADGQAAPTRDVGNVWEGGRCVVAGGAIAAVGPSLWEQGRRGSVQGDGGERGEGDRDA